MPLCHSRVLSYVQLNRMLHEVFGLILDNPAHEIPKQAAPTLRVLLELLPLPATKNTLLVQAQVVDTELLQVRCIVCVGNDKHL